MRFRRIMRFDPTERKYRIVRVSWIRGNVGAGRGYSAFVSLSIVPRVFHWGRGLHEWRLTVFGVSVHYLRAYGGIVS